MLKKFLKKSDDVNAEEEKTDGKIKILFDEQWPKIESFIVEHALKMADDKLNDEAFVEGVIMKSYELLPAVVRLVISREKFMTFVKAKQEPLKEKIRLAKTKQTADLSV